MSVELYAHNQKAYQSVRTMLDDTGKAALIHPTGTGKSYVAFRLIEDLDHQRFLWLSPSEYIFRTQMDSLLRQDPGFPKERIMFLTYARLMLLTSEELEELRPDYIILDEFHRCGAKVWGKGLQALLDKYPSAKILGLSATAIRYLDMADRYFDLVNLVMTNNLDVDQETKCLEMYEICSGEKIIREKYLLYKVFTDYLWLYWHLIKLQQGQMVEYNEKSWKKRLDRALFHLDQLEESK